MFGLKQFATEGATPRMVCCFDAPQHRPAFENLIQTDSKTQEFVPGLATEWKLDSASNTVTFTIRKGVPFHRGKWGAVTPEDVVFTYESLVKTTDPPSHTWAQTWWKSQIQKVEAVGADRVVFHIKPHAEFWLFLSDVYNQLPIRSKKQHEAEGEPKSLSDPAPVGTGPYEWVARAPGQFLRYKRVDYKHWRITPEFPEFEFRFMNEASTRLAALLTGEIHMTDLPPDLQPQAERAGMKAIGNATASPRAHLYFRCCYIDPDTGKWPMYPESALLDKRVREALNRAIDREELGRAFAPKRSPMPLNHFAPGMPGWDPSWERRFNDLYGYDPERARRLLAEAGYSASKPLKITVVPAPLTYVANGPDLAEAVAGYFRRIGVDVALESMDPATENALNRAYKLVDHVRVNSTGLVQLTGINVWQMRGNPGPAAGYYTPEILAVADKLRAEMDPDKQAVLLREIGEWGFTNYWDIPLWYVPLEVVVNPKIVASYDFPGSSHGGWSHFDGIKAAR